MTLTAKRLLLLSQMQKTFLRFLFWSRFYVFLTVFIFQTFFYLKKTLAKFRAASRLTTTTTTI